MDIKVIGSGCDKCDQLYENVQQAVTQLGLEADIEKVEDLMEIVKLGIMSVPAVMVDGNRIVSGRVPKTKELVKLLSK